MVAILEQQFSELPTYIHFKELVNEIHMQIARKGAAILWEIENTNSDESERKSNPGLFLRISSRQQIPCIT